MDIPRLNGIIKVLEQGVYGVLWPHVSTVEVVRKT